MAGVENAFAGIVITAETFNPSIFTETWLAANGILPSESLVGVRTFSPEIAQFQTSDMQVVVLPPKFQMTFGIHGKTGDFAAPREVAKRVVALLPHTPYRGLGLNFDYFISPTDGRDISVYSRAAFGEGKGKLLEEFAAPDAKFGRHMSKDHGSARLKLEAKPVRAGPDMKELMHFSFNFDHSLSEISASTRTEKIAGMIDAWEGLREYSARLVALAAEP